MLCFCKPKTGANRIEPGTHLSSITRDFKKIRDVTGCISLWKHKNTKTEYVVKTSIDGNEYDIMEALHHQAVATVYCVYLKKDYFYIVEEYFEQGDLLDAIVNGRAFSTQMVMKDVLHALSYIHSCQIAHCDIKPENICLCGKGAKLVDFGLAQRFDSSAKLSRLAGTMGYVSPEMLCESYTELCDMWAVGVVAFILLFRFNPFDVKSKHNTQDIKRRIQKGFTPLVKDGYGAYFPSSIPVSSSAKDFISSCLVAEEYRMTAQEALLHPFITELKN